MFRINQTLCLPLIFVLTLLTASCSFNKSFYHPDTNPVRTPPDAESIYVPYGKNDSIHALFYHNQNEKATIFMLHGNAGSLASWSEVADLFYQANYSVFTFDYPGFGNSSGMAKHDAVLEATDAAVNCLDTMWQIRDSKLVLMGFSLGGNLAVKVGHDNDALFDAMVIEGAFDSHKTVAKNQMSRPIKGLAYLLVKNKIKGNELIQSWKKPLLVIHSKDDRVCDYSMGKSLYDNAIHTSQKELWTIKGPHLAGLSQNFSLYMAKMNTLLEKIDSQ